MARNPSPLSLAQKVQMHAERIAAIDSRIQHLSAVERPAALAILKSYEEQVIGKASGWEDATLSGYIPEHAPKPAPVVEDVTKKKSTPKKGEEE
jgi:hypothetical protein